MDKTQLASRRINKTNNAINASTSEVHLHIYHLY